MKKRLSVGMVALSCLACGATSLDLLPYPAKVTEGNGVLRLRKDSLAKEDVRWTEDASVPAEGYVLTVAANGVSARHADAAGAFYAQKTLEQLVRPVWTNGKRSGIELPCVTIEDAPRFAWRGFMVDDARHFLGKELVKKQIDLMSRVKMNVFHWHFTDDEGWRLELKRHPEICAKGAVRPESMNHGATPGKPSWNAERHGPYFYTQEDVKEILAYAAERHVTVVPEIDFPAHSRAVFAAHPEFTCIGPNETFRHPWMKIGPQYECYCAANEAGMKFIEDVLDEVAALFPGKVIHIGGDECPPNRWRECPKCQALKKRLGLKDERELQVRITRRFAAFLKSRGKEAQAWDETLSSDMPDNLVMQLWRDPKDGCRAAEAGVDVVLSPVDWCYFSIPQGIENDPFQYLDEGGRTITLEKAHAFDPFAGMSAAAAKHVRGIECCTWGEMTWNWYDFGWKMWPRAFATAETAWSGPRRTDYADFYRRVKPLRDAWAAEFVNPAPVPPPRGLTEPIGRDRFLVSTQSMNNRHLNEKTIGDMKDAGIDFDWGAKDRSPIYEKCGVRYHVDGLGGWSGRGHNPEFVRNFLWRMDEKADDYRAKYGDSPLGYAVNLGDEPSGTVFPFLRKAVLRLRERFPDKMPFLNLFPNYAALAATPAEEQKSQLGTTTYEEYLNRYCRNLPLDYISYDFYIYSNDRYNPCMLAKDYENKADVFRACRRTGRSFWFDAQVNSYETYMPDKKTSRDMMRWQALSAMAFGAEQVSWACWTPSWWTNDVHTATGEKTELYDYVREVNAELHRLGAEFMKYRVHDVHFVGYTGDGAYRISQTGIANVPALDTPWFSGVKATDGSPLVVGEMVARQEPLTNRAIFVFSADDPWDRKHGRREVLFKSAGKRMAAFGLNGSVPVAREADGVCRIPIESNRAVLIACEVAAETAFVECRSRLSGADGVGTYLESLRTAADGCRDSGRILRASAATGPCARFANHAAMAFGTTVESSSAFARDLAGFRYTESAVVSAKDRALKDVSSVESASDGWFMDVQAEDERPLLVGRFVSRKSVEGPRAMLVVSADDPDGRHPRRRRIVFRATGKVRAVGERGPVELTRDEDGRYNLFLESAGGAAFVTMSF